jgi:hypothetical protein
MLKKQNTVTGASSFLPALPPFIREVHKGCGVRKITTRKEKKETRDRDV